MVIAFAAPVIVNAQTAKDADFDGDGTVGFNDFVAFAGNFGTSRGDGRYDAKYDLNNDGQVGFADFVAFARFFGQSSVPNDPPVLERIGDQGVPVGVPLAIELVASDPDDDNLTYHVSGSPAGSSFSGSTFRWTPTSGEGSTRRVTFTVNDGRGGTDSETITIRVVEFRFKLVGHRITTEAPSFVNILFQVLDMDNWGVTALTTEHFEVRENDQEVSPTESAMRVQKRKAIPHRFKLKTVLMLDTSTSIRDHLEQIKQAAIILVENMTENQEIALYEFSEDPVLLQDFTSDVEALTKAIREIRLGFSTTNLYGSIITGTRRWQDVFTTNEVQQGFLVILTDGSDTQGSYTLSEALEARGSKNIYTIGLGNEIDPEVLRELGNAGFFQISDVTELADQLAEKFVEIQKRIVSFADSFYWLRYLSPKRGDREHRLELRVQGNQHDFMLYGEFNSRDFYSVRPEVFVNRSPSNNEGIKELKIAEGDTVRLEAVTSVEFEPPQYVWESSDSEIVAVEPDPISASVAWAIAIGDSGQTAAIGVFDEANGLERQVRVEVSKLGTGFFALPGGALLEMVKIAPGTFQMGSPRSEQGRNSVEGPVHEVKISKGFYLGKYEVTQAQWEAVMGSNPSRFGGCGDCPVERVSWRDAQSFIRKLNEMEGQTHFRLPSEAEWEFAARAGTTTRYSWGDEIGSNRANCDGCGSQWDLRMTAPVGSFPANPWGLHDM
ncbi:MAG: SUMF1/EgtB/PvdO family nonheme iron enzyme, partial [Gemmatimonadetes bacterium]|nr:SUMF1/EgtB/PvdO family nonheme iron enzyme [Gemmatimonadota bacterium]